MSRAFKTFQNISSEDFKYLWRDALIIFDTNALLNIYRLPEFAKDDFLNILSDEKINNRIWLPFQSFLEFSQNRLSVISEQKKLFLRSKILLKIVSKSLITHIIIYYPK
ncbi:PIN-like domain-containing protein [Flavobacterium sp. J372]|uniref:PIN-like domain-containing protein n=1 Tax=Flavobacterium sp. J372 TaxID=2898436 RepID=UPI0035B512A6